VGGNRLKVDGAVGREVTMNRFWPRDRLAQGVEPATAEAWTGRKIESMMVVAWANWQAISKARRLKG
jgi:hypothetical protein